MQCLRQLLSRVRAWRVWNVLGHRPVASAPALSWYTSRPLLREVTPHGVRVYSLCGCCGAHLTASATLCDACARSRSAPNS